MKRRVAILLVALLMCLQLSAQVSIGESKKLPNEIWSLFEKESVLDVSDDVAASIEVRLAIIALFDSWADEDQQKLDIVTPRLRKIAEDYETLKKYVAMTETLESYIYYAGLQEVYGGWDHDAVLWAESKLVNSQVYLSVYAETNVLDNALYYGAMYEPSNGVLFGSVYDKDPRISDVGSYEWASISPYFPKKNSAYLMYLEFGTEINQFDRYYQAAVAADTGVQLAWNAYQTYDDMSVYADYIERTASYLQGLGVPVFMRYGSEMNIAEGMSDAAVYVENYQFIAEIFREIAPDVALVWSVNDVTASDRSLDAYYPGDQWVDWVGISTYTYYYFGDKTDWGDVQEDIDNRYYTGSNANPISKVKEVVDAYGDRKPIMITESGVAHYSKVAEEDMTEWAKVQLERQYAYMPLIYPQIKGIFYFNTDNGITPRNSYALYENQVMNKAYNELVADDHYISEIMSNSDSRYVAVGSVSNQSVVGIGSDIALRTYSIVSGDLEPTVEYYIDGVLYKSTNHLPYDVNISSDGLSTGIHDLLVQVKGAGDEIITSQPYTLMKNEAGGLSIEKGDYNERTFTDIDTAWSKPFVLGVAARGIIVGSEGLFRPEDFISRAEMTSIISKLGELETDLAVNYSDVASSAWYYKYVSGAQAYLIGYGNVYEPGRYATREEIIAAFVRMKGYSTASITSDEKDDFADNYTDVAEISPSFYEDMILAVRYGIVGGYEDGSLRPKSNMKRGEVAKVIFSTFYVQ